VDFLFLLFDGLTILVQQPDRFTIIIKNAFMKSSLLLLCCIISSTYSTAQSQAIAVGKEDCKTGYPLLLTYEFNGFHFNGTAARCERGFWVNFTGGKWSTCYQGESNSDQCRAFITAGNHVRIVIELHQKYALLHFPLALTQRPGYAAKDSAFLIMNSDYELPAGNTKTKLIAGEYPVRQLGNEWLIEVASEQMTVWTGTN
jgi:hypothetical protein